MISAGSTWWIAAPTSQKYGSQDKVSASLKSIVPCPSGFQSVRNSSTSAGLDHVPSQVYIWSTANTFSSSAAAIVTILKTEAGEYWPCSARLSMGRRMSFRSAPIAAAGSSDAAFGLKMPGSYEG